MTLLQKLRVQGVNLRTQDDKVPTEKYWREVIGARLNAGYHCSNRGRHYHRFGTQ